MNWIPVQSYAYDWVIIAFLTIAIILAFVRSFYAFQFKEFLKLPFNNKYIIIFSKKEKIRVVFTFLLTIIQWISWSIMLFFLMKQTADQDIFGVRFSVILLIFVAVILFFLIKWIFQRFVIYVFDIKLFGNNYLFNRLSYSNYAGLVLCILNFIIIFGFSANYYFFYISLLISLYLLLFGFFSYIKLHKISIKSYFLYFILYLCTFEIAPYIFIGYLLIINK